MLNLTTYVATLFVALKIQKHFALIVHTFY